MRVWTQEQKDQAATTRLATKQKKEERERKRLEKLAKKELPRLPVADPSKITFDPSFNCKEEHADGNGTQPADDGLPSQAQAPDAPVHLARVPENREAFDWDTAPVNEIINRQADMRREYERISQIVLRRQNPPHQRWTCFTQENVELIKKTFPDYRTVLANCLKRGEDGRANFRDDGRFVTENGVRRLKPAFCCNSTCYKAYVQVGKISGAR